MSWHAATQGATSSKYALTLQLHYTQILCAGKARLHVTFTGQDVLDMFLQCPPRRGVGSDPTVEAQHRSHCHSIQTLFATSHARSAPHHNRQLGKPHSRMESTSPGQSLSAALRANGGMKLWPSPGGRRGSPRTPGPAAPSWKPGMPPGVAEAQGAGAPCPAPPCQAGMPW